LTPKDMLLKLFGWIPIPIFLALKLLSKEQKHALANNTLATIEEADALPELVSILLYKLDEKGYNYSEGAIYASTDEEVDEAMNKFPLLTPYRIYFHRWCERHRREVGLPI
jgi:hypothetical protein